MSASENMDPDVQGEATEVGGESPENGQQNSDSGYNTLVNSRSESLDTLNGEAPNANENMDIDPEVASTASAKDSDGASTASVLPNMSLQCEGCMHPYDDCNHIVLNGDCGHGQCATCWKKSNYLCSKCHLFSPSMKSTIPLTARDEAMDVGENSGKTPMNKGVVLKNSPPGSSSETAIKKPSTTLKNGVLLKSSAPDNSTRTANSVAEAPKPQSTATEMANITVKCMDGRTVKDTVNPTTTSVGGLKRSVHMQTGISYERQNLLHRGQNMQNTRSLHSYNVVNGSTIQMGDRCTGG